MMNTDSRECRDLIAKLSDGTLSATESLRLNEILKLDPIAQQAYLDHLFMDGLLEREFCGVAQGLTLTSKPEKSTRKHSVVTQYLTTRLSTWRANPLRTLGNAATLTTCFVLAIFAFNRRDYSSPPDIRQPVPLVLSDAGFESHSLGTNKLNSGVGWFGNQADIVEHYSGVAPLEGKRMLHLDDPDSPQSNQRTVYQVIDLYAEHQPDIDARPSVFASANFNSAIEGDHELQLYGVQIYAFAEKPVRGSGNNLSEWGRPLAIADRQLAADFDEGSWQNVSTQLNLPPEARYLVIQLSVIEPDSKPDGEDIDHFVDKVSLSLVSSH